MRPLCCHGFFPIMIWESDIHIVTEATQTVKFVRAYVLCSNCQSNLFAPTCEMSIKLRNCVVEISIHVNIACSDLSTVHLAMRESERHVLRARLFPMGTLLSNSPMRERERHAFTRMPFPSARLTLGFPNERKREPCLYVHAFPFARKTPGFPTLMEFSVENVLQHETFRGWIPISAIKKKLCSIMMRKKYNSL